MSGIHRILHQLSLLLNPIQQKNLIHCLQLINQIVIILWARMKALHNTREISLNNKLIQEDNLYYHLNLAICLPPQLKYNYRNIIT